MREITVPVWLWLFWAMNAFATGAGVVGLLSLFFSEAP